MGFLGAFGVDSQFSEMGGHSGLVLGGQNCCSILCQFFLC